MLFKRLNSKKNLFSTLADTINLRVPLVDPQDGEMLDNHLNRYHSDIYSAYLYKRRINRKQISAKIHIIDQIPAQQQPHLKTQTLYPIENSMNQKMMQRLVKQDPTKINSAYVISVFCQDHFKLLIDQYTSKVLICGKAPKQQQKMNKIQEKAKQLYKIFYFGSKNTELQRQIQLKYLSEKQNKYILHNQVVKKGKKNQYTRCIWKEQDQRILEDLVNFKKTDLQNDDTNYRPFYQPLQLLSRLMPIQKLYQLLGGNYLLNKWQFNKQVRLYYTISDSYYSLLATKIYNRIHQYINSIQFTNLLQIPPDFMIQMSMYQMHIWIVTQRLNQINTIATTQLSKKLLAIFKKNLEMKMSYLKINNQGYLVKNLHKMLWANNQLLKTHFVQSSITKDNHYIGIDSLVWAAFLFQKTQRYSNQVYLTAEYLLKNYVMTKNFKQIDYLYGNIEFDPYMIDPRYKQIITQVNPQLTKQQFDIQLNSEKQLKRYTYNYVQKGVKVPLDKYRNVSQKFQIKQKSFLSSIARVLRKYQNLDVMDHYDTLQQQEKQQKRKQKQTVWKSKVNSASKVHQQFQKAKSIRKSRKQNENPQ